MLKLENIRKDAIPHFCVCACFSRNETFKWNVYLLLLLWRHYIFIQEKSPLLGTFYITFNLMYMMHVGSKTFVHMMGPQLRAACLPSRIRLIWVNKKLENFSNDLCLLCKGLLKRGWIVFWVPTRPLGEIFIKLFLLVILAEAKD